MSAIDWIVFLGFLAYVVFDGVRRARGTRDLEGYFAGSRSIPWWAAGLSVMATQASAITVIGTTGQGHDQGMEFVQIYFALPFAMILLCIFMVPLYRKAPILTAYEYLEGRFGPATRTLASLIFLVSRCLAFGLVLYAPAVVLSAMIGVSETTTVIIIGVLTTAYTMIGGIKAVIWTDVKQMTLIIGGLLLALGFLLSDLLGTLSFGELLDAAGAAGQLNPVEVRPESLEFLPRRVGEEFDSLPRSFWEEKYNLWSGLIGGLFLMLAYFGTDQSQVQRILTNPTVRESRLALLLSAFAKIPMQVLVLFLGVLLWLSHALGTSPMIYDPGLAQALAESTDRVAVEQVEGEYSRAQQEQRDLLLRVARGDDEALVPYQAAVVEVRALRKRARQIAAEQQASMHGVALPDTTPSDINYIFPHYLLHNFPPVLLGLMIAAIFAAAMSSSDSALNSLTSSAVVDIYRRWFRPDANEAATLRASRVITVLFGICATAAALMFRGSDSIIEVINKVGSFFYGSLLGVFVLALCVPRAGPLAGFLGLAAGMVAVLVVHFTLRIEYLWYNVIGVIGVLVVGVLVALKERPSVRRTV